MKPMLWALGAVGVLVCVTVLGLLGLGYHAMLAEQPAPPALAEPKAAIVDPFKQPAPPIADPFKAQPAAVVECPAGFVNQGGACIGQESVDYQADVQRRRDIKQLADDLADELRDD